MLKNFALNTPGPRPWPSRGILTHLVGYRFFAIQKAALMEGPRLVSG